MGCSFTQVVLYATNKYAVDYELRSAKGWQRLVGSLKPGQDRDKATQLLREALDNGEYFQREVDAILDSSETLKEIEGLEAYRDFLSETVVPEKV